MTSLTTIKEISERQLLTSVYQSAGQYHWWGLDTQEAYNKNCIEQPADWPWRDRQLTYTVNSQGYRAPEWDQVSWADSLVIYGCSYVFGDGVNDDQTLGHQLSQRINRPVINLGSGGSGPLWQLHNQVLVHRWFGQPWASIVVWPSASRTSSYSAQRGANRWGSWNFAQNNWTDLWNQGTNPGTQLWFARELSRSITSNLWIDASFDQDCAELLQCTYLDCFAPSARDNVHPGPGSLAQAADVLASKIGRA